MSHADALTLQPDRDGAGGIARWTLAGAVILAAHAGVWFVLQKAPPATGFETPPAIEMDLVPPPSGEAQTLDAGETTNSEAQQEQVETKAPDDAKPDETPPEELQELTTDEPPSPPDEQVMAMEEPLETVEAQNVPTELADVPPDVTPEVVLPQEPLTAREEVPEPRREVKKPEPKPVVRREKPREQPRKPAVERRQQTETAKQTAGGASGVSTNSGAARASAADYGRKLNALLVSQKRYPPSAQGASGRAMIAFTVNRNGSVTRQSLASSSGNSALDQELMAMLRRAAPSFPPMPADVPGASKSFTIGMNFTFRS